MPTKKVEIINQRGLHARASAKFVSCARAFDCDIRVMHNGMTVPAVSVMGLMMLVAGKGSTIELSADGPQADTALDALSELVAGKFGED
ncbi:MAG: HPr family phosphocarrier protein [Parvibaculales bacterium]